jgi:hypothetical protein
MSFTLKFTAQAEADLNALGEDANLLKRFKAVRKALGYLETNPRHPGLNTHKYSALIGHNGEEIFEAYAENKTPAAYRIFWFYGPEKKEITIVAITPHPWPREIASMTGRKPEAGEGMEQRGEAGAQGRKKWRRERDSNPRYGY